MANVEEYFLCSRALFVYCVANGSVLIQKHLSFAFGSTPYENEISGLLRNICKAFALFLLVPSHAKLTE